MLKSIPNKRNILFVFLLIFVLILVRVFENQLFYDPFLAFFKDDYQHKSLPEFDSWKLFFGLLSRYFINGFITILILFLLFKDFSIVKLSAFLLLIFFVILIVILFVILHYSEYPDYLTLFYIRRFLIQPLFLILFVPAFFYQQKVQ